MSTIDGSANIWAITTCRVSTPEQKENHSLDNQAKSVLAAAEKLGAYIPPDGQWSGDASSKCGKNIHRKDIQEMLEYCKRHKRVKYLLVSSPDRFMRSIDEALHFEVEFRLIGVTVYYTDDPELNGANVATKLRKLMKYYEAEASNEERIRKGLETHKNALNEGRLPCCPKFGYKKTFTSGIHDVNDDCGVGALLGDILSRIASGVITPTEGMNEMNAGEYISNGKRKPFKMDKWKKIISDPYYAGYVVGSKQVKVVNPNGLHKPLITKEQHEKILEILRGRKSCHCAPRKNGNPHFPLSRIMLCEECHKAEIALGNTGRHDHSKFCGYTNNNGNGKYYDKYECRKCHKRISREYAHEAVREHIANFDLTEDGRKRIIRQLEVVWKDEERNRKMTIVQLKQRMTNLNKQKEGQVEALCRCSDDEIKHELEGAIKRTRETLKKTEDELNELENSNDAEKQGFMEFALDFVDNLAKRFFDLSLDDMRKCELLMFPSGFMVGADEKVCTPETSPFYRGRTTKKDLPNTEKSLMAEGGRFELPLQVSPD